MFNVKPCVFCRKIGEINIHNTERARKNLAEYLGSEIWPNLQVDDRICSSCEVMIESCAGLRRNLLFFLSHREFEDEKPTSLKRWRQFAARNIAEELLSRDCRQSPSPNLDNDNLLVVSRIESYESPVEFNLAQRERIRSQSSLSRGSTARSDADSEVARAFSGRRGRRKRGHGWTRRKNGRYSRPNTDSSWSSRAYSYTNTSRQRNPSPAASVASNDNNFDACEEPVYCPSVSISVRHFLKCKCTINDCTMECEGVEFLNDHKILKHGLPATHLCTDCNKKYTSKEDLGIHRKIHMNFVCVICQREFDHDSYLLEHWKTHVNNSVPCPECGKRFVNKDICDRHQRTVHRTTLSRIDYDKTSVVSEANCGNSVEKTHLLNGGGDDELPPA